MLCGCQLRQLRQHDQQRVSWFILDCLREVKELAGLDISLDVDVGVPCSATRMTPIELLYACAACMSAVSFGRGWRLALASPPRNSRLRIHHLALAW